MARSSQAFANAASLAPYIREIKAKVKPLSKKHEFALAASWRENGDLDAMHKIVTSYAPFAIKIAADFARRYGMPFQDLVGEANMGLMEAVRRFDPAKGFRFSTYSQWWIRAQIQEYILGNWSLVKIGTSAEQKKLFFNLNRLRAALGDNHGDPMRDETCKAISKKLGIDTAQIRSMEQRMTGDSSLDAPMKDDGEGESLFVDFMESADPTPEDVAIANDEAEWRGSVLRRAIENVLNDPRERDIFIKRRLTESEDQPTLDDLSKEYGVTRERIRQIEVRALEKVQAAVLKLSPRS